MYDNEVVLGVMPPETTGAPHRFNAALTEPDGREILRIRENEWLFGSDMFDVETTGARLVVRRKSGDIALVLSLESKTGIAFERIDWRFRGFTICASGTHMSVTTPRGGTFSHRGNLVAQIGVWMHSNGALDIAAAPGGGTVVHFGGEAEA